MSDSEKTSLRIQIGTMALNLRGLKAFSDLYTFSFAKAGSTATNALLVLQLRQNLLALRARTREIADHIESTLG